MLRRRLQVLIDDERYERLRRESEATGVPVGEIVRRAIDRAVPVAADERSAAIRRLLAAEPIPVPDDPADLEREILEARAKRSGG
jgi:Ribbon-helix-helix domain